MARKLSPWEYIHRVALKHHDIECLIWPYMRHQRGHATYLEDGDQKMVGRYICAAAHGEPENPEMVVRYSCENGTSGCVNPRHVLWAKPGESRRGSRNNHAKITAEIVLKIYRIAESNNNKAKIARWVGVSRQQVTKIVNGQSWTWLYNEWRASKAKTGIRK